MAGYVVVFAGVISDFRLAVGDEGVASWKSLEEVPDFVDEWMLCAVASTVAPPDFAVGFCSGEEMEHGEHRRRPYARALKRNGAVSGFEKETASGRADPED